jgi:anti-sigma regulatory factor (Ser/Thr protein kinase)
MQERFAVDTHDSREAVGQVMEWFMTLLRRFELPERERGEAYLALDEIVTNIANYAYRLNEPRRIATTVTLEDSRLQVEVVDEGRPFNPLVHDADPVDVSLEKRRIGGLGIRLAMHVVDEMHYKRKKGRNYLTFVKELSG